MAKLFFRYGAMSCGKSLDLIRVSFNYEENNKKVLIFTSAKDDRYGKNIVKSRTGLSKPAISISDNMNIFEYVKNNIVDCVLVDEVQFLTKEHIIQLSDIVDFLNIPVIAYGLRSDFIINGFEGSNQLLVMADKIEELKTLCWCGKKATINARLVNNEITTDGDQILIGDINYVPLCRKHFKEKKLK